MEILNVQEKVQLSDAVVGYEYHNHIPFGSPRYGNNDEIRITIPEIDNYVLPCESYLYVQGKLRMEADETKTSATAVLINNAIAFMFSDIRYLINGVEVDAVRNVGITSTMKGLFSFSPSDVTKLQNVGWDLEKAKAPILDDKGNFSANVPLKMLLGFAEDFKKIVMNVRQELILIRSNDDKDAVLQTDPQTNMKIIIDKLIWRVPHVKVGLRQQLLLMKLTEKNNLMQIPFRGWEIHENPSLPETTKHSWSVKTAPQLETPRYIILGFQTKMKGLWNSNMSGFSDIGLTNVTAYLNGKRYPYENLNMDSDFVRNATLYDLYSKFQKSYYNYENGEPILSPTNFKSHSLVGIDCTHQEEGIHKSGVEIRIEFTTSTNIPKETVAYCLILHDKLYQYSPFNKVVQHMY